MKKVEEALKAIEYPNVDTIQIIFNIFRQRPAELFFQQALKKNIGIIARVPLASGLLSGKYSNDTVFSKSDHRNFNRNGEAFDKGETFSGINYDLGLEAVEAVRAIYPETSLAAVALKWILSFEAVSCVIPGASNIQQLHNNVKASDMPPLTTEKTDALNQVYSRLIKEYVHHLW